MLKGLNSFFGSQSLTPNLHYLPSPELFWLQIGSGILIFALYALTMALIKASNQLKQIRQEVQVAQATDKDLEIRVEERILELRQANEQLQIEVRERKWAEVEVHLLQQLAQAISESYNLHSALGKALQKVCQFTNWKFAEAWTPSNDGTTLELNHSWDASDRPGDEFQLTQEFRFPLAVGLPGRVWSSKEPEWIQDVATEPDAVFLQNQLAAQPGLRAALGVPIIASGDGSIEVLAVLVFFVSKSSQEDKRLVKIVSNVANQLGSFVERKRTEDALRQSQERFRLLVESVKDYAIYMLDQDGHIASWNIGAERIKGYRAEEILGRHFSCFYPNEDIILGKPEQELLLCQVKGQIEVEGLRVRQDQSSIWVNVILTALRDPDGKLRGFSKVTRDITERKRAEDALRESEERLNAVLDNSTALIYVKDTQGRFILINSWYETLFHLNREEVRGKTDYDIFPQELAETYRAHDQIVLRAQAAMEWEEVTLQDDGFHTYISIKFPLYDSAGVAYAVCGISTDITERKQAEEALRKSLNTNRALLNAIPDLMIRISKDGTFVNYKAAKNDKEQILKSNIVGRNLADIFPPDVAEPAMKCLEQALKTGETQVFEYQLMLNYQLTDFEARIVVSAEDEVMAIVRDITERKRVEEDIRQALEKQKELSELKSRFVSMTSHEFRTPLTTILSSAELLEKYSQKLTEEKKLQHLHRIQASVNQMTKLLNDVLLIGKAETNNLKFNPSSLNLVQFCHDLVGELEGSLNGKHTIKFDYQGKFEQVWMDEKLLLSILSNLLSNAIKYSPQGGIVRFDLIRQSQTAIFQIQDWGIGIPAAEQTKLFDSFHRASNVGTISGTGLGLAIVKKSVELHSGTITVKSEVGVGTTFEVLLPLNHQI